MIRKDAIRAPGAYDVDEASKEAGFDCVYVDMETGELVRDEGLTQQQFKEESDINEIVRRFGLTGEIPGDFRTPVSGDFTGVVDFHSAMNAVREAQENFMKLPGELRARFGHDPQRLIEFCEDGRNLEEARKLGLVPMPVEKPRDVVQAVDELAAALKPKG